MHRMSVRNWYGALLAASKRLLHKRSGQEAYVKGQDITVSAQFAGMLTNDKEWCQSQIEGSILIDDFVYRQQGQFFLHLLSQHSSGSLCL
eukprot:scaffold243939_cov18-Tisochrysis_lutea.AAC.2